MLHWTPGFIKQLFISLAQGHLSNEARDIISTNLTFDIAANVLYLAHCESIEIAALQSELIEPHLERLVFYYSPQDQYTPRQQIDAFKARFTDGM
jgi:hypothetical protein